ncbi:hypothetical protein AB6A40_000947 [Gnathostoma spinigerum]|uniref:Cytochrome c domain-containing protein n=1 Tax=Gnathostoma spinigerum TaxID=75299 RepID=A0ABD6E382_9BILA
MPQSMPEGDYERGKKAFMKRCSQCHVVDSKSIKNGPTLHALFGRTSGQIPGYNYSEANIGKQVVWGRETLYEYLKDPKKFIPGTKMTCAGIPKEQERADIVKYVEVESAKPPKEGGLKWSNLEGHKISKA